MDELKTARFKRRTNPLAIIILVVFLAMIFACGMFTGYLVSEGAKEANNSYYIVPSIAPTPSAEPSPSGFNAATENSESNALYPSPSPSPSAYYKLSVEERAEIEQVVMAEAGGEDYDGQRLVAQCILNACLFDDLRPLEAIEVYGYTPARKTPSESVVEAVSAVFDRGDFATSEPILYFYSPNLVYSAWHESQSFVLEHGGHKFFAKW